MGLEENNMLEDRYTFTMHQQDGTIVSVSGNKLMATEILEDVLNWMLGCTFSECSIRTAFKELGDIE